MGTCLGDCWEQGKLQAQVAWRRGVRPAGGGRIRVQAVGLAGLGPTGMLGFGESRITARHQGPGRDKVLGDPSVLLTIPSVKVNIQGQRKAALTHIYIKNKSLNYLSSFAWGLILCPCSAAQYICPDKELQSVGLRVRGCKKYRCQINWLWHSAAD